MVDTRRNDALRQQLTRPRVGSEEVIAVAVEVASGAVVVLGGARVGMPGQDLGIAQRHACVPGVGDGRMPQ